MAEKAFDDIVNMICATCRDAFYRGTGDLHKEIISCATQIYIAQMNIRTPPFKSNFDRAMETAKAEAIKEFAERLKEKEQWEVEYKEKIIFTSDINNLVKEMVEDNVKE